MVDSIKRYMHEEGQFRVWIASTTEVGRACFKKNLPMPIALQLLVQGMTGAALLADTLKDEGALQLRFSGDGPMQELLVESNTVGDLRGYVEQPELNLELKAGAGLFQQSIGTGQLHVKRRAQATDKTFTSVVPLVDGELALNLANYLLLSEQIASGIQLGASLDPEKGIAGAGGIMIQAMPGSNELLLVILEDRLSQLPSLGKIFSEEGGHERIASWLFEDLPVRLVEEKTLNYRCNCTRDRMIQVIASLPVGDLDSLLSEGQELTLHCHFCQTPYTCTPFDLKAILEHKLAKGKTTALVPEEQTSLDPGKELKKERNLHT